MKSWQQWVPWITALGYAAVYSWLGIVRYHTYHASNDDGLFVQTIASALSGFRNTPEGINHFAFHFSPILVLIAPAIWTWKSAIVLVVVAAIAGALTIPPVYAIARHRMPYGPSLLVAAIVALYPALGGLSFTDFSENAFAPAAAAWLLWAIDQRRMPLAALFAAVCLSVKEDQAVILTAVGLAAAAYFWRRGERRWLLFSLGLCAVSIATFTLFITVVRPATGAWYGYPSIRDFYGGLSAAQLFASLFTAPRLGYLFAILLPLLGICLLSRCMWLALPGLLECLTSRVPLTYMVGQHYAAVWVPYVLVAFAFGAARLWRASPRLAVGLLGACLCINLYINVAASPNDWSANLGDASPANATLDRFIAGLPRDAPVTAFPRVYAHLGMDPNATPYAQSPTTYAIVYPQRDFADWDARERAYLSHGYRLLLSKNGIEVYERK